MIIDCLYLILEFFFALLSATCYNYNYFSEMFHLIFWIFFFFNYPHHYTQIVYHFFFFVFLKIFISVLGQCPCAGQHIFIKYGFLYFWSSFAIIILIIITKLKQKQKIYNSECIIQMLCYFEYLFLHFSLYLYM